VSFGDSSLPVDVPSLAAARRLLEVASADKRPVNSVDSADVE